MGRVSRCVGLACQFDGLFATDAGSPEGNTGEPRTAKALSEAFGAVAAFVRPSVVQISVHKKVIHPGARILLRLCGQRSRWELILTLA